MRIQLRHDTAATWIFKNPVLLAGEAGVEVDTHKVKFGDGSTHWTDLPYAGSTQSQTVDVSGAVNTAIQNLHLGTAATHAATDFDPAGAGAAAIASGVAVTRCFTKNVTTMPPLPGVLTLTEGAFGYYVDEMPVVSDGHTAWMVSGYLETPAVDVANSPYFADGIGYGLPFILPFDLDNEVWLDPIPIPLPPYNTFNPPPPPEWTEGGTITSRNGWSVNTTTINGVTARYLGCQRIFGSLPTDQVVPNVSLPSGWTLTWTVGGYDSLPSSHPLVPGDALGKYNDTFSTNTLTAYLLPDSQATISSLADGAVVAGPVGPPSFSGTVGEYPAQPITWTPPRPTVGQAQGIWGAEGMYAGLIGRKIYFGGGDGDLDYVITSTMLASYDLDTGEFDWTLPNLPEGRFCDYQPHAVADDKLWVVGAGGPLLLCSFDPATGVWTTHSGTVPIGMSDQMQGVQVGRTILWPVDSNNNQLAVYDLDTDTWDTSGTPLGLTNTPAVATAPDGNIWVVGQVAPFPAPTVETRIIAPDGTITTPAANEVRFDGGYAPSNDVRYGVLPLPDVTFGLASYFGLAFRASDGKPFLFGGTTVKTAELRTLHVPYLHANTTVPLGDGSVETVAVGPLPSDPTKLAAIALDGTATALRLASDPILPGLTVSPTPDNSSGVAGVDVSGSQGTVTLGNSPGGGLVSCAAPDGSGGSTYLLLQANGLFSGYKHADGSTGSASILGPDGTFNGRVNTSVDVEVYDSIAGVILHSPDGTRHRIKVADDGSLSTETVT